MAKSFFSGITTAYYRGWLRAPDSAEGDPKTCTGEAPGGTGRGWRPLGVIAPGMGGRTAGSTSWKSTVTTGPTP